MILVGRLAGVVGHRDAIVAALHQEAFRPDLSMDNAPPAARTKEKVNRPIAPFFREAQFAFRHFLAERTMKNRKAVVATIQPQKQSLCVVCIVTFDKRPLANGISLLVSSLTSGLLWRRSLPKRSCYDRLTAHGCARSKTPSTAFHVLGSLLLARSSSRWSTKRGKIAQAELFPRGK